VSGTVSEVGVQFGSTSLDTRFLVIEVIQIRLMRVTKSY
jgi:hypothetical protein